LEADFGVGILGEVEKGLPEGVVSRGGVDIREFCFKELESMNADFGCEIPEGVEDVLEFEQFEAFQGVEGVDAGERGG
jgi:hypothetical protein